VPGNLLLNDEHHLNFILNKTLFKAPDRRHTDSIKRVLPL